MFPLSTYEYALPYIRSLTRSTPTHHPPLTPLGRAVELRDGGSRYLGKGVLKACANVNDIIAPSLLGKDPADQTALDDAMIAMDGTDNKGTVTRLLPPAPFPTHTLEHRVPHSPARCVYSRRARGAWSETHSLARFVRSLAHLHTLILFSHAGLPQSLQLFVGRQPPYALHSPPPTPPHPPPFAGNLGANAILGVSLALSKAGAAGKGVPLYQHYADLAGNDDLVLPVPSFNVINGGSHAGNKLAMQEFMILPTGAATFTEAMTIGCEVRLSHRPRASQSPAHERCTHCKHGTFGHPRTPPGTHGTHSAHICTHMQWHAVPIDAIDARESSWLRSHNTILRCLYSHP